jgi:hypothetical protein
MKYITTIIKKIMSNESPKVLGRWNIDYCNKKVNHKVDLSNEDHCGPCGQYALTKLEPKNENTIENTIKDTDKK